MQKTVNMGSPYTHRITLRLTDEQFDFIARIGKFLDVSPSDYLRMCVNTAMLTQGSKLDEMMKGEVGTLENVKTDIDSKL